MIPLSIMILLKIYDLCLFVCALQLGGMLFACNTSNV